VTSETRRRLRVAIVDDEAPARQLLVEYLAAMPDCELVASCADGYEALRAVASHQPDLLVLDIQMPKLTGFDVLDLLETPPAIIFATAYDEHAVRAFEVAAVDYLLKPFSIGRLQRAIERARQRLRRGQTQNLDGLIGELRAEQSSRRILVREDGKVHILTPESLDYVESQDDYILLHTSDGNYRKKQTLTSLAEQLAPNRFVRVHRCFVVNLDRLDRLEPYSRESRVAVLHDGTKIPVSRSGYSRLREHL
jgi:two-component system LytT family response regulator